MSASDVPRSGVPVAAIPIGTTTQTSLLSLLSLEDALDEVGKLPSTNQRHLEDFVLNGNADDAQKILVRITVMSLYPARPIALAALSHRSPLVLERALRALTAVGISSADQRRQIEGFLGHADAEVSAQAAVCLGAAGDLRACPALIARLRATTPKPASPAVVIALRRLSNTELSDDPQLWEDWYKNYRVAANDRLATHVQQLESTDQHKQIQAVQALSGLSTERAEVVEILVPYANSDNQLVALAAAQALATLAPREFAQPTRSDFAKVLKPVLPPPPPAPAFVKGLFDTWMGVMVIVVVGIFGLSGTVFFLRTPAVREATRRFKCVVVASTERLTRPLTTRIRKHTDRVSRALTDRVSKGKKV